MSRTAILTVLHEVKGRLEHDLLGNVLILKVEIILTILFTDNGIAHDQAEIFVDLRYFGYEMKFLFQSKPIVLGVALDRRQENHPAD